MFYQNLDALPRADAIKLLLNIAGRIGDHADEIARLCGDLPLALRVAAGALAERPNLAPADYARRLADAKQRLSHLKEVDVALNVSYETLTEEQRRLWRALAVFPQTFNDEAAAAVWEMERAAAQDALGDLMKWSLVEFNVETGRYRLHDLARLFAEARLFEAGAEEIDAAQKPFVLHYGARDHEGSALGNLGLAWAALGEMRKAIEFFEQQLAIAREVGYRRGEGNALGNLGIAYKNLGETRKAIEFQEQVLGIVREIGDRRREGQTLGNLGNAWYELGETRKAIEFYEQILTITREIGDRWGGGRRRGWRSRSRRSRSFNVP